MHRRRLGKLQQRTKYQRPRPGVMLTKHQSPIVCLRMYRGILYACSLNGQVRFYQTQTLSEHPRHQSIFTPNGGTQTLQVAHCKRFGGTILCVAGFDQTVRLYRDHPSHESRGEIMLAAPVHCSAVKFHILMVGLGSGEVAFISLKKVGETMSGDTDDRSTEHHSLVDVCHSYHQMFTIRCLSSGCDTGSRWSSSTDCLFVRWLDCGYFTVKWTETINLDWTHEISTATDRRFHTSSLV